LPTQAMKASARSLTWPSWVTWQQYQVLPKERQQQAATKSAVPYGSTDVGKPHLGQTPKQGSFDQLCRSLHQ
jgi:hypothetical protein